VIPKGLNLAYSKVMNCSVYIFSFRHELPFILFRTDQINTKRSKINMTCSNTCPTVILQDVCVELYAVYFTLPDVLFAFRLLLWSHVLLPGTCLIVCLNRNTGGSRVMRDSETH